MSKCEHIKTIGRNGESGLFCFDCGAKVYDVEKRPCGDCAHFVDSINGAFCAKKIMHVIKDMRVSYKIAKGTCFSE